MKYPLLLALILLCMGCQNPPGNTQAEILPIQFTIRGQLDQLEDVGRFIPPVHFSVDAEQIEVKVGANEYYRIPYSSTNFNQVLALFEVDDFKSDDYFFNPNFSHMGYLEIQKEIEGQIYHRKFSNYRRRDIPVTYLDMEPSEVKKFATLSNYLNELAINCLKDDPTYMATAYSLEEAFAEPEKVYKLKLRNSRVSILPPEIEKLVNLRVLDISGARIRALPPEIDNCTHLHTILANASPLSKIPGTIGNLKKLRFVNFGACKIKELPEEFGNLTSLWHVSLGSNQLSDLPASISNLKNAQMFNLSQNNFDEFPEEVLGLEMVGNLWMHGNNFKSIPKEIANLKELHHFLVDAHEIQNLTEIKALIPEVRIIDEIKR